ncbi:AraC family transcriptional regulator [Gracilibacillus oryzae]|uniref:AraC family transcriptional regulator n=1 Tax=Gracilibacillus oryzae TaxID=1672701 RepID=A0A7C8GTC4_9BACI|nr:AraC family transcriptional regulator [Gracilibacillus oryzae]KAB8136773.1 AraC family transcriptional regulator [Gracilibacillus oryzae]
MLSSNGTYFFNFTDNSQDRIVGIHTLGWEKRNSASYFWDGLERSELGKVIFQYTLKGEGEITIDNQTTRLKAGEAFFVTVPSNHQYYFPEDSEEWEFVHITLYGQEALRSFEEITRSDGHILTLDKNSTPIQIIFNLYNEAVNNGISDVYQASSNAYTFLMELKRAIKSKGKAGLSKKYPKPVEKAIEFIHNNYSKPLALDDIVEASGVSKYHFSRLFNATMHITPLNYVVKIRMEQAVKLLKNKELTIEEIALKVGYANGNYFSKAFRSIIGVSPGKYRNNRSFIPFEQIIQR